MLLTCLLALNARAQSGLEAVPPLQDFQKIAGQAQQQNLPILLVVSQHHCAFCQKLKREVLDPMMLSGDYVDQIIIVELLMDDDNNIKNLQGESVYPGSIVADHNVWVTPTLLFLDYQGKEVEKRMIGVNTIEMYGYYLDESIRAAHQAVRDGEPYKYRLTKKDINGG